LPPEERREAIAELKSDGHSNREIAKLVGVGESTVRNDLSAQNCAQVKETSNKTNGADNVPAQNCALIEADPEDDDDDADDDDINDDMSPKEIAHGPVKAAPADAFSASDERFALTLLS
jgi:IS30 family transposase